MSGKKDNQLEELIQDRDIILKSDDCDKALTVKQSLLVSHSKYFEGCILFDNSRSTVTFDSKIVSHRSLKLIVEFMETSELNPSIDTMEELFLTADYLQIESALEVLYDFLLKNMKNQDPGKMDRSTLLIYLRIMNIVSAYVKRNNVKKRDQDLFYNDDLKQQSCEITIRFFLAIHAKRILSDKAFLHLDVDNVYKLLSCNVLDLSEAEVLLMVKVWINHDFEARKKHFERLLECVQYDEKMVDSIFEEVLCLCKHDCFCLTSKDFVIAYMAVKNSCYRAGMFQLETNDRFRGKWRKPWRN